MRNTYKYTKLYSGGIPEFIEGDVFRTIIPLNEVATGKVGPEIVVRVQDTPQTGRCGILPLLRQRGFQGAARFPAEELPEGSGDVHGG